MLQHRAFWTGRFDVGNLTQAVWSTAHGDVPRGDRPQGRQISRLGAHFDPIVALFAPALVGLARRLACSWWCRPLAVATRRGPGVSCSPAGISARSGPGSDSRLVYLLYPPTQWLVVDDFHPVALATPLLLGAIWFLDAGPAAVRSPCVAGAACLTKEQIGLVVAVLGLWYARRARAAARGPRDRGGGSGRRGRRDRGHRAPLRPRRRVAVRGPLRGGRRLAGRDRHDAARPHPLRVLPRRRRASRPRRTSATCSLPLVGLPLLSPLLARDRRCPSSRSTSSPGRGRRRRSTSTTRPVRFPGLFVAAVLGAARLQRRYACGDRAARGAAVVVLDVSRGRAARAAARLARTCRFGSTLATRDHVVTASRAGRRAGGAAVPDPARR